MSKKKSSFDRMREAVSSGGLPKPDSVIPVPPEPNELWQIVVAGQIDPRQHFPEWYRSISCITDEELDAAKKSLIGVIVPATNSPVIPPALYQFDVGAFAIIAVQDKWIIQTITESNRKRILEVASTVFSKLYELPIQAYGINKTSVIQLKKMTAKRFLADKMCSVDLGLPQGSAEAQINYTIHLENSDTTIQLGPSATGDNWLTVMYNRHHPIKLSSKNEPFVKFDLDKLLVKDAELDWVSAKNYCDSLAESVNRAEGR